MGERGPLSPSFLVNIFNKNEKGGEKMNFWKMEKEMINRFLLLNSLFFEDINDYIPRSREIEELLNRRLKYKGWTIKHKGIWFICFYPEVKLPSQGWKIHVSANRNSALKILDIVLDGVIKFKTNFKVIVDLEILQLINSKIWPRPSSGKFITIYPINRKHFEEIIEYLYKNLKKYEGPYVLSDRRYKDSKCVYYRYGGFKTQYIINLYGEKLPIIYSPYNKIYIDKREPYFTLPPWEKDFPFNNEEDIEDDLFNGKYRIEHAISFSNCGGVYKAIDVRKNKEVIIKEARPNIYVGKEKATESLEKEYELLKELEKIEIAPKVYEIFKEWEHTFLVEELLKEETLATFMTKNESRLLLNCSISDNLIKKYHFLFKDISLKLCDVLNKLHSKGIIFGDLSPNNIFIEKENKSLKIKLIDFEGANKVKWERHNILYTPGFSNSVKSRERRKFNDDYYAFGNILLFLLFPFNRTFLFLSPRRKWFVLRELIKDTHMSKEIYLLIKNLLKGKSYKWDKVKKILERFVGDENISKKLNYNFSEFDVKKFKKKNMYNLTETIKYILWTYEKYRADGKNVLFPLDPRIFFTNHISVAYGESGVIYGLNKIIKKRKSSFVVDINKKFIKKCKSTDVSLIPPGLFIGSAGVSWTLLELGEFELSKKFLDAANNSSLLLENLDIVHGISGVGLANVKYYKRTGENKYLLKALDLGKKILDNFKDTDKYYFVHADVDVYIGYALGSSGVAYFLLILYCLTGDSRFLKTGKKFLNFDLSNIKKVGGIITSYISLRDRTFVPYWYHGSSGIGTVLLRYWYVEKNKEYEKLLKKLALDSSRKYAISPSQFVGLAGLGEFLLDLYLFKKQKKYLYMIKKIVDGLDLHKIPTKNGIAFLGRGNAAVSTDYASGSIGIALFYNRILNNSLRDFMLDEIVFANKKDDKENF